MRTSKECLRLARHAEKLSGRANDQGHSRHYDELASGWRFVAALAERQDEYIDNQTRSIGTANELRQPRQNVATVHEKTLQRDGIAILLKLAFATQKTLPLDMEVCLERLA